MTRPQATQAQLLALTFPALSSVVRTCTPVRVGVMRNLGVVHAVDDSGAIVSNCDKPVRLGPDSPMVVYLADATGRAHLMWSIAASLGDVDGVLPSWWLSNDLGDYSWRLSHPAGRIGDTGAGSCVVWSGVGRAPFVPRHSTLFVIPAAGDLDPNDDTRLPDGSRWVDAEALRLVGLHVLGGAA